METATALDSISAVLQQIPENEQEQFAAIAARWADDFWSIGDYTNTLLDRVRRGHIIGTAAAVYGAVRAMLNQEVSVRTIERWARVAAHYTPAMRHQYDMLPFAHLELACRYGGEWWRVLDASMNYLSEYGRPPSVEWLIRYMANKLDDDDNETPEDDVGLNAEKQIARFLAVVRGFYRIVDELPIPNVELVRELLERLQGLLEEVGL